MTGQWEKYVTQAAEALDPTAFDPVQPNHDGAIRQFRRDKAAGQALAVLATVGPLIAEDTRDRMVAAAARLLNGSDVFVTHYEWQPLGTAIWHPCPGKDQLVRKLERFGGRGRMCLVGEWDAFPDPEMATP